MIWYSVSIHIRRRHELSRGHSRWRLISSHLLPVNHSRIDDNCTTSRRDKKKFDPFFGEFDFLSFSFCYWHINVSPPIKKESQTRTIRNLISSSSNLKIFYTNCVSTRCGKWPRGDSKSSHPIQLDPSIYPFKKKIIIHLLLRCYWRDSNLLGCH